MEIIKWKNTYNQRKKVKDVLLAGGVIVYPTETSYGLGADPCNLKAIKKIYAIKKRPLSKSLPLIASSYAQVLRISYISNKEYGYIRVKWPGPYTLILRRREGTDCMHFTSKNLAIRISGSYVARSLARLMKHPIISTSANISGQDACYDIPCVISQFKNNKYQPDLVIDCGKLPKRKASTILQYINGKVTIVRT